MSRSGTLTLAFALCSVFALPPPAEATGKGKKRFAIEEATIAEIQSAILRRQISTTDVVKLYLERIQAFEGTCVNEPEGILGPISTIPNADKLNAFTTLNLRPARLAAYGFDPRKARSITDSVDADPSMPDALEAAAAIDAKFRRTGRLV